MAKPLFTNNAYSTLASGITDVATSLTVDTGHGARFPALSGGDYFYATLIDTSNNREVVKVTARSTDAFTIERGADNSTAQAFSASDRIELRVTAAALEDIRAGTGLDTSSLPAGVIDAAALASDAVETAKVLDNNITLAKMTQMAADGLIGNDSGGAADPQHLTTTEVRALLPMVADSGSGGTAGFAPAPGTGDGTSGKEALLSGAATYIRPTWRFIEEVTGTGANLDTSVSLSDYEEIEFILFAIPSGNDELAMQIGTSGPTWLTTGIYAQYYSWLRHNSSSGGAGSSGDNDAGATNIEWSEDSYPVASTGSGIHVKGRIINMGAAREKMVEGVSIYKTSTVNTYIRGNLQGYITSTGVGDAVRFFWTSGANFASSSYLLVQGRKIG